MDPGLGKTRIAWELIRILLGVGEVNRVLIIAPKRVCESVWVQERDKWNIGIKAEVMCGRAKTYLAGGRSPYVRAEIINPESLHLLTEHAGRWDMAVIDESTKFKSWSAARSKSLRKLLPSIPKRVILTGTPAANSLGDLFAQVFILDDGEALGRNITVHRSMYMAQGGFQGRVWQIREDMKPLLLEKVSPMCLRLDAETCLDMPELIENDIPVTLPPEAQREYNRMKRDLLAELESGDILAMNRASAYCKMKQLASGSVYDAERNVHHSHTEKVDAFCDLVAELNGKPVLGFFEFTHEADRLLKKFPKAGVLSGKTKRAEAKEMIDAWNGGRLNVLLCQTAAASHGLNLQGGTCADVVFSSLGDSYEKYDQAFRRVYRQGVKGKQVRVHRIICRGTVDEIIRDRLHSKGSTQSDFLEALKRHAKS